MVNNYLWIPLVGMLISCSSTPSGWVISSNDNEIAATKQLILQGKSTRKRDRRGDTPFLWAARNGQADLVKSLIEQGAKVNRINKGTGETALILAAKNGHKEVVKALINHHAKTNVRDFMGKTAVEWASESGDKETLEILLGSAKQKKDSKSGNPIVAAVYSKNWESIRLLLSRGYSLNDKDSYGETPLHAVAKMSQNDLALEFLDRGADPGVSDKEGRIPLMWATQTGNITLVHTLMEKGSNANHQTKAGYTALTFAVTAGNHKMIEILCEKGAEVNIKDNDGLNLTYLAALVNQYDTIGTLIKMGAFPERLEERILHENPMISAPMFEHAARYYVYINDKENALKYLRLAAEYFSLASSSFRSKARNAVIQKYARIFGQILLHTAVAVGSEMQARMQAKQMAQISSLYKSNSYSDYFRRYGSMKKSINSAPVYTDSLAISRSLQAGISSIDRNPGVVFKRLSKNTKNISAEILEVAKCVENESGELATCLPK